MEDTFEELNDMCNQLDALEQQEQHGGNIYTEYQKRPDQTLKNEIESNSLKSKVNGNSNDDKDIKKPITEVECSKIGRYISLNDLEAFKNIPIHLEDFENEFLKVYIDLLSKNDSKHIEYDIYTRTFTVFPDHEHETKAIAAYMSDFVNICLHINPTYESFKVIGPENKIYDELFAYEYKAYDNILSRIKIELCYRRYIYYLHPKTLSKPSPQYFNNPQYFNENGNNLKNNKIHEILQRVWDDTYENKTTGGGQPNNDIETDNQEMPSKPSSNTKIDTFPYMIWIYKMSKILYYRHLMQKNKSFTFDDVLKEQVGFFSFAILMEIVDAFCDTEHSEMHRNNFMLDQMTCVVVLLVYKYMCDKYKDVIKIDTNHVSFINAFPYYCLY